MNNIRTGKAMFLAGMIAAATPMEAAAADAQQNLKQEIVEQGNTALEAMSTRLVHDMNWDWQVSRQPAKQTLTQESGAVAGCPQAGVPMNPRAGHDKTPPATPGDFRTAGIMTP